MMLVLETDPFAPKLLLKEMSKKKKKILSAANTATLYFKKIILIAYSSSKDGDFSLIKAPQLELCAWKPLRY